MYLQMRLQEFYPPNVVGARTVIESFWPIFEKVKENYEFYWSKV